MNVRVKICGITGPEALEAAVESGADAVGFVMSPSPRAIDARRAADLIGRLPPWVASVVVTRQPETDFAARVLRELAPDWWQSDRADLAAQPAPHGIRALPVIREGEATDSLPAAFVYEGRVSGSGTTVDWPRAATLARRARLVLAGGLDCDNVGAAIRAVRPWAVDVSSGVERARGVKDPQRIAAFVAAVRSAASELGEGA